MYLQEKHQCIIGTKRKMPSGLMQVIGRDQDIINEEMKLYLSLQKEKQKMSEVM